MTAGSGQDRRHAGAAQGERDFGLTPQEQASYRANGFLVREAQFDADEVAALQGGAEAAVRRALATCDQGRTYVLDGKRFVDIGPMTVQFEPGPDSTEIKVIEPVHGLDERLAALLHDPRLVAPMRTILGVAEIALWTDKLNLKRPRAGSGFGWHQDSPYWIHDCGHVDLLPNVMVALDDAREANGCLRVIRGSHRRGCLPGTDDGTQLGGFYTDPGSFDLREELCLEVPAGSLIFFDPHLVHGSRPNASERPRRAMVITYQPAGQPTLKSREVLDIRT
ncbi:MAG TPA: phytanoyl-CoA dioxygenase family protein [Pseudomonadales bacterium]|nr:phytanoyl-CoA dioxygenase family protein [Pseudomonadales bacterium]